MLILRSIFVQNKTGNKTEKYRASSVLWYKQIRNTVLVSDLCEAARIYLT